MTHKEVYDLLCTLDIPVAYDHFEDNKVLEPPLMVYREIAPTTFKADSITYFRPYEFEIEIVTEKKDVALQKAIEELLTNNNIPYDVDNEVWDNEDKIYHYYYNI